MRDEYWDNGGVFVLVVAAVMYLLCLPLLLMYWVMEKLARLFGYNP